MIAILKKFKWQILVGLIILGIFGWQQYKINSLNDSLVEAIDDALERVDKQMDNERKNYESGLKDERSALLSEVRKLKAERAALEAAQKEAERKINEIKKKTYTRSDIDIKLDSLFKRNGVGTQGR